MTRRPRIRNAQLLAAMAEQAVNSLALAKSTGIAPSTISQALNLRVQPSPETIAKICAALKRTPAQLGLEVIHE